MFSPFYPQSSSMASSPSTVGRPADECIIISRLSCLSVLSRLLLPLIKREISEEKIHARLFQKTYFRAQEDEFSKTQFPAPFKLSVNAIKLVCANPFFVCLSLSLPHSLFNLSLPVSSSLFYGCVTLFDLHRIITKDLHAISASFPWRTLQGSGYWVSVVPLFPRH